MSFRICTVLASHLKTPPEDDANDTKYSADPVYIQFPPIPGFDG